MLKSMGCYAMALLYVAAGINHFVNADFYLGIMPRWLPAPGLLVLLSGVAEVVLGLALLVPVIRPYAARAIMAMLLAFLVVHIDMLAAYQRYDGVPLWVLVARLPLQGVLLYWAYLYARKVSVHGAKHP